MNKLEIILLDQDLDFAGSLRDYIRTLAAGTNIGFKQFTKIEALELALKQAGSGTVLIIADVYWPLEITTERPICVLLEESEGATERKPEPGQPWFVYKYQPLEQLMSVIGKLAANRETQGNLFNIGGSTTRIVTWYSAAGGSGKSTAAFNLAQQLAQRGEEVCLVSLEAVPSGLWGERDDEQRLAEWLYFAQTKPAKASERIAQVLIPGVDSRLRFTVPFTSPTDAWDMRKEDARLLLRSLRRIGSFAWIIVDAEAGWSPRVLGALDVSDLICWIILDDWPSYQKTAFVLEEWRQEGMDEILLPRTSFFCGKYLGESRCRYDRLGVTPDGALPYVPQWKTLQQPAETTKASFYSQQLWHGFQIALKRHEKGARQWNIPSLPD